MNKRININEKLMNMKKRKKIFGYNNINIKEIKRHRIWRDLI
jgi:hypothetical protein